MKGLQNALKEKTRELTKTINYIQAREKHILANDEQDDYALKNLKSSSIIMIYGLVEYTINMAFEELYSIARNEGIKYSNVNSCLREAWIRSRLLEKWNIGTSFKDFSDATVKIFSDFYCDPNFDMVKTFSDVNGNYRLKKIIKTCKLHGIVINSSSIEKYGKKIEDLIQARNNLSHGNIGFEEYGKTFTSNDLYAYLQTVYSVLFHIVEEIEKHIENRGYVN